MGSARLALVRPDALDPRPRRDAAAPSAPQRVRIVDGALRCIARQGIAKTTLDDVAQEAGCSRATVYRVFPGGKENVLAAVFDTELARFYSALAVRLGDADNLEDVLVEAVATGAGTIASHPALTYLLAHEPGLVLPHLTFAHMDQLLADVGGFMAPFLGRFLDHDEAVRVAQFTARIALSYLSCPAEGTDITDHDDVRRLVRRFVLPGITSAAQDTGPVVHRRPTPAVRAGTNRKGEAS
ncbi:MAG TPA: TetR/AcrR family transcriptional regulator [Acidimicrobiales bacterium]|nr:TetR/AcrR family transcriptional regulator [Acidimicrobiales bacterium]